MEKRFNCSKEALTQTRITFWFYVGSIPIIIFLFMLPYLRQGQFVFGPYSLVYVLIIGFLVYSGYRAMRVMLSVKNSFCVIENDRIYGVSTPNPYKKGDLFDIRKSEILGIGSTTVSTGGMRAQNALVLNTQTGKYVLFAIERADELRNELQTESAE